MPSIPPTKMNDLDLEVKVTGDLEVGNFEILLCCKIWEFLGNFDRYQLLLTPTCNFLLTF